MQTQALVWNAVCIQRVTSCHVRVTLVLERLEGVVGKNLNHVVEIHAVLKQNEFKFFVLFCILESVLECRFKRWSEGFLSRLANIVGDVRNCKVLDKHCNQVGLTASKKHVTRSRDTSLEVVRNRWVFTRVQCLETVVPP